MTTRPTPARSGLRFPSLLFPSLALSLLLLTLSGLSASLTPAEASGSRHPYFNDRGTLEWYHSYGEAQRAARSEQKLIFVEYGRQACSNCRKIATTVLPHSAVRPRLSRLAVGLASECDAPERAVYELFQRNLRNARTLPFCGFVTPRGRWITGWGGGASVSQMQYHLDVAEARHRAIFGRSGEPSRSPAQPMSGRSTPRRTPQAAAPVQPSAPVPAPVVEPKPDPVAYSDADLEKEEADAQERDSGPCEGGPCEGGQCTPPDDCCRGGQCTPPSPFDLPILRDVKKLLGGGKDCDCPPKDDCTPPVAPRVRPPEPGDQPIAQLPETSPEAMPPAPECTGFPPAQPERQIASLDDRSTGRAWPRPATDAGAPPVPSAMPFGDPDAEAPMGPRITALPPPTVQPSAPRTADQMLAETAAKRGDWQTVLRLTRDASNDEQALRALNRQAHAWAHGRLAYAVRAIRAERFEEARRTMDEVGTTMQGEPESVDAQRGLEAVESMQDMIVLAEDSPLRTTVRQTAYEKMRGTRWAPLFSDVPAPSLALSKR